MAEHKQAKDTSAPPPIPPVDRKSIKAGLLNQGAVSENERPKTSVSESINMHFDAIGSATLRKGSTLLGNALTSSILGMHYHVDTVGVGSPGTQLIVVSGTIAYYLSGG